MIEGHPGNWWDKVESKFAGWDEAKFRAAGFRAVPGSIVRRSAFIAKGVVLMPSFVNVGAYVGENTMVDGWSTVGSCAQIGRDCHLSGGVGIGGVLEPLQASPTIIEDNCFIGARSEVAEGVVVGEGSVLSMGVFLTALDAHRRSRDGRDIPGPRPALFGGGARRAAARRGPAVAVLRRDRQARRRAHPRQDLDQRSAARLTKPDFRAAFLRVRFRAMLGIGQSGALMHYLFSFYGRINRAKLWLFLLITIVAGFVYGILFVTLVGFSAFTAQANNGNGLLAAGGSLLFMVLVGIVLEIALFIASLAVATQAPARPQQRRHLAHPLHRHSDGAEPLCGRDDLLAGSFRSPAHGTSRGQPRDPWRAVSCPPCLGSGASSSSIACAARSAKTASARTL